MGYSGNYDPSKVMNGTYGYLYIDGEEVLSLEKVTVEDTITYEPVTQPGQLRPGQKMTGVEGTGEFTVNRVNHRLLKNFSKEIDKGKQPSITITTTIADPNAEESQTMVFYDCTVEKLTYVATEPGTLIKDSFPFHYRERKFID